MFSLLKWNLNEMENERINKLVERFTLFRAELVKEGYSDNEVRDAAAMMFVGIGLAQGFAKKDLLDGYLRNHQSNGNHDGIQQ